MKKKHKHKGKPGAARKPARPIFAKWQMTPEEYLAGWRKRQTWKNLEKERHQERLKWCANQCVGDTFVDVGCALGHSTAIMRHWHPGAWTGIEFEDAAAQEARLNFPEIAFIYAPSVAALPATGRYDSVVCSEVIEHVESPRELMGGLLAIADKRIIITTPCVDVDDPGHVRLYGDASLKALLEGMNARVFKDDIFYKVIIDIHGGGASE